MRIDSGGGGPTLDPKALAYERELFTMFTFADYMVTWATDDWQTSATSLRDMSTDLGKITQRLRDGDGTPGASGWTGPAADAATASLSTLASTLDDRAVEMDQARAAMKGLTGAYDWAKEQWYCKIVSNSDNLKPEAFTKTDPVSGHPTSDPAAYAAAVDAIYEERNTAAKGILDALKKRVGAAADDLPVEDTTTTPTPYSPAGSGGTSANYATNTATTTTTVAARGRHHRRARTQRPPALHRWRSGDWCSDHRVRWRERPGRRCGRGHARRGRERRRAWHEHLGHRLRRFTRRRCVAWCIDRRGQGQFGAWCHGHRQVRHAHGRSNGARSWLIGPQRQWSWRRWSHRCRGRGRPSRSGSRNQCVRRRRQGRERSGRERSRWRRRRSGRWQG